MQVVRAGVTVWAMVEVMMRVMVIVMAMIRGG
jgi:hypothetical protein